MVGHASPHVFHAWKNRLPLHLQRAAQVGIKTSCWFVDSVCEVLWWMRLNRKKALDEIIFRTRHRDHSSIRTAVHEFKVSPQGQRFDTCIWLKLVFSLNMKRMLSRPGSAVT